MEAIVVALIGAFATVAAAFISKGSSKSTEKQKESGKKQSHNFNDNYRKHSDRNSTKKYMLWVAVGLGGILLAIFTINIISDPSRSAAPTSALEEMILQKYDKKILYKYQIGEVAACFCVEDVCYGNLKNGDFLIKHGGSASQVQPSPGYRCE